MNWATGIVLAIVIAVFAAIIFTSIRNRKKGKASCACSCGACSGCPMGRKRRPGT